MGIHTCKCGEEFENGYAFSSHRCAYKKNPGAFILVNGRRLKKY